ALVGRGGAERAARASADAQMTVSLKEDALVLVTEDDGGLPLGVTSPLGLYYHDTQYLSGFALRVNGMRPILLSANTEQNYVATFQLMHTKGPVLGTARHATEIALRPAPDVTLGNILRVTRSLGPQQFLQLELAVTPREDGAGAAPSPDRFDDAIDALNGRYRRFLRGCSRYTTSSETLDEGL